MDDLEERIRRRAHEIWEREGCPDGRDVDHWQMAREEIANEDNLALATKPNPVAQTGRDRTGHPEPVEPLEAVKNLGEFPGLTDQGDESRTPEPPWQPDTTPPKKTRRKK